MADLFQTRSLVLFVLLCCTLTSCISFPKKTELALEPVISSKPQITADCRDNGDVHSRLLQQYREWRNTPYRMGGMSKRGVDCSGFVYLTYREKFGYTLPRTTELQIEKGREVSRSNLRPGDLLFFKTGWLSRHVGIYLGEQRFIHASSSRGVITSGLAEDYWNNHYWTARRICR